MIIGISGKKKSGKDLTAKIIQYLTYGEVKGINNFQDWLKAKEGYSHFPDPLLPKFQLKHFGDRIKEIAALIFGITREEVERLKETGEPLPKEWNRIITTSSWGAAPEINDPAEEGIRFFHSNEHSLTMREFLQRIGTDVCRLIHPGLWAISLLNEYQAIPGKIYLKRTAHSDRVIDRMMDHVAGKGSYSVEEMKEDAAKHHEEVQVYPDWIIADTRFRNEVKRIRKKDKAIIIRVNRPFELREPELVPFMNENTALLPQEIAKKIYALQHRSETELDNFDGFDHVIENNGSVEELVLKVKEFVEKFKIKL